MADHSSSPRGGIIVPVLAGGGARLPAHIGILDALAELDIGYREIVGVSGGAIVAALVAAGYPLAQGRDIAETTDFSSFLGQNVVSLMRSGGLSDGNHFEQWIDDLLGGRRFRELPLPLHVVATDVRSGKAAVFNPKLTPDMRVSQAVRYSMSVPLLFSFKDYGEGVMADGSILSEEALRRDWSGDGTPVVVFKLRGSGGFKEQQHTALPLKRYLAMLLHTFMTSLSHEYINESFWLSTIVVDTGDISPLAFSLGLDSKRELYAAGRDTTLRFLPLKMQRSETLRTS